MKTEPKDSLKLMIFFLLLTSFSIAQNLSVNKQSPFGKFFLEEKIAKPASVNEVIFQDDMNGDNSISGLESRGWIVVDADGAGIRPAWYQGGFFDSSFTAFEGPIDGYVASDWLGGNGDTGILDHWLISPQINVTENDTISFWIRSEDETYDDSISIYLSPDGGGNLEDFSLVYDDGSSTGRYLVPFGFWSSWRGIIPLDGTIRFAIRYHTRNTEFFAWYLGVDLVEVRSAQSAPIVQTTVATNIAANSATLNGIVNPNGLNTTYEFEWGTSDSYGNLLSGSGGLSGNEDINVDAELTGLSPNTTYHYRINASNIAGISVGDDAVFTTAEVASDVDLEWRTLAISTLDWKVGSSISAEIKVKNNGTSTAPAHRTQLYLSTDTDIELTDIEVGSPLQFSTIAGGDSSTLNLNFDVPSVNTDIYYVGAIVDFDNMVAETNENNNNYYRNGKVIVGYPDQLQQSHTLNFNSSEESSSYRMIGLPGNSNLPLAQLFSGTDGEDWVAYYDNGGSQDYLVLHDGSSTFNLAPGRGFWVLSNSALNISRSSVPVVLQSLITSGSTFEIGYPIDLHNGWNIISNPFEVDTDWSTVQIYNGITESIHDFTGNYATRNTLSPYKGYYFFNATNLPELFIPYFPGNGTLPKKGDIINEKFTVELWGGDSIRSYVILGSTDESKVGYDLNDRYSPPGDFTRFHMFLLNEKLESEYKNLQQDIRTTTNNQIYDLRIKYPEDSNFNVKIEFDKKSLTGNQIILIDQMNNSYDISKKNDLTLKSYGNSNNLKLLIGDNAFIEAQLSELLPTEYRLEQNYPNPFNPVTKIKYSIPVSVNSELATVSLVIYDILGREVVTLVEENQFSGNYEVEFDASSLTSGIYFYKLTVGNFNETRKMVLLK